MAKSPRRTPPAPEGEPNPGGFIVETEDPRLQRRIKRRKTSFFLSPLFVTLLLLGGAGGGVYWVYLQQQRAGGLVLGKIESQTIEEGKPFEFALPFGTGDVDYSQLNLKVVDGPKGAKIDGKTGRFEWTPSEEQGPGEYVVTVQSEPRDRSAAASKRQFKLTVTEVPTAPKIAFIENVVGREDQKIHFPIDVEDPDLPPNQFEFRLAGELPAGAYIDPATGIFDWYPDEAEINKPYSFRVEVSEVEHPELKASRDFQVTIRAYDPVQRFKEQMAESGVKIDETGTDVTHGFKTTGKMLLAFVNNSAEKSEPERLDVFPYGSRKSADDEVQFIDYDLSKFFGKENEFKVPTRIYRDDRLFVIASGVSPELHKVLALNLGTAIASTGDVGPGKTTLASTTPVDSSSLEEAAARIGEFDAEGEKKLAEIYKDERLFHKKEYGTIRGIFANRFAKEFDSVMQTAWPDDYAEMAAWLDERAEFKEELFTAIAPNVDNVLGAMTLLHQLREKFPDKIDKFPELTVALCVVWDDPKRGPYDYGRHQRRTHTTMPDNLVDALTEYEYLTGNKLLEARMTLVPWEFLKHVVNHKTPVPEQIWAVNNYLPKGMTDCYQDVPYDHLMLRTSSQQCQLQGKEYNLPNIRQFGGVCAMQADFAARVGKSMGVPSEYVGGESASGDQHAWVMWVELKNLTRTSINFSLESKGRYRDDKYYVGTLKEPQSGRTITDRELELRLHTVGLDRIAKRQAQHAMSAYPLLKEKFKFSIDEQMDYLDKVIALSPGNETAWAELARLAGEGDLTKNHEAAMRRTLDKLFATFANFPDFTWKIFDNLIQFEDDISKQIKLYERLLQLYVQAGRPDLACEARLMLTGYLIDAKREREAVEGLAATIMAFPDEGRYAPKLLDRLEVLCVDKPVYQSKLLDFYKVFLPKIPQKRGDESSKYCMKMYERAIERFKAAGDVQQATRYQNELNKLKLTAIP